MHGTKLVCFLYSCVRATMLVAGWRTQDLSMMVMRAPPTHQASTFAGVGFFVSRVFVLLACCPKLSCHPGVLRCSALASLGLSHRIASGEAALTKLESV
jgi:hypothetical protein